MKQGDLFKTKFVRGKRGFGQLFEEEFEPQGKPVACLGMTLIISVAEKIPTNTKRVAQVYCRSTRSLVHDLGRFRFLEQGKNRRGPLQP